GTNATATDKAKKPQEESNPPVDAPEDGDDDEDAPKPKHKKSRNTLSLGGGADAIGLVNGLDLPDTDQNVHVGLNLAEDAEPKKGNDTQDTDSDIEDDYAKTSKADDSEDEIEDKKDNDKLASSKNGNEKSTPGKTSTETGTTSAEKTLEDEISKKKISDDEESELEASGITIDQSDDNDEDDDGTDEERAQLLESFLELKDPQINWKMIEYLSKNSLTLSKLCS
ncbi:hypothetical protein RFI_36395, partial [Reticulomyxa filosa]